MRSFLSDWTTNGPHCALHHADGAKGRENEIDGGAFRVPTLCATAADPWLLWRISNTSQNTSLAKRSVSSSKKEAWLVVGPMLYRPLSSNTTLLGRHQVIIRRFKPSRQLLQNLRHRLFLLWNVSFRRCLHLTNWEMARFGLPPKLTRPILRFAPN